MRRTIERGGGLALGALVLVATACSPGGEPAEAEAADTADAGVRIINVEVVPAARTTFRDYIRITGEVEALHDVTLSAEEAGPVTQFLVPKGRRVEAGDAIAKIDDAVLRSQVEEARAQSDFAQEDYRRRQALWEREHVGSEMAYLQAKAQHEQAQARLATLEARLARTVIRAPVAGIFDEKFVEAGEMVAPGTPVARVVSTGRVKVTGGVPERYALAVARGDTARVTLDVLPGRELVGRVAFVGSSVDQQSRTVPVEVELRNPDGVVKPRMVANVQIQRARVDSVFVVSQQVLTRTEDGYLVFVATERDGYLVASARPVQLGPSYQNEVVIERGLEPGDSVIVVGARMVDDGSRVRIVHEDGGRP